VTLSDDLKNVVTLCHEYLGRVFEIRYNIINPLKTKRRLLYSKTQSVPRSK